MKRTQRTAVLLLAGLGLLIFMPYASNAQARRATPLPPSLAKAKLAEATAAAKKWKADAVLIQVVGSRVGAAGLHVAWDYGYWAPSAKGCLVVNIGPPGSPPFVQESGGPECQAPELKGEFMDSDRAMAIARSNGITAPTSNMGVSMTPMRGGTRTVWLVMDGGGTAPGNVLLDIDAQTGAVLNKTTQR